MTQNEVYPSSNIKKNPIKSRLNPDQERAATAPQDEPLLIVAGAGTGKTKTLTTRVLYLIENGVPAGQICAITFTNKAAREMEERINSLYYLEKGLKKEGFPYIGTFHALGARILRRNATLLGRTPSFIIFDDHDSFSLIKRILKAMDRKKENPSSIYGRISAIKNGADLNEEKPFIQEVFGQYEAGLEAHNAFDFDDLLSKTVLIFRKFPNVLLRYQEQFTHLLIDEYQDLNDTQYEFVKLLVGKRKSISVVGDAEQTIYGWRGSNIDIFLRFPDDWSGAKMITLTQNYRSTPNILRAAAGVIQKNKYETKIKRATELWTENTEGEKVLMLEILHADAEADWVADTISTDPQKETAILYRTNAQSRAIEQALLRRHIPYQVYGGLKFYERKEIKDIVAALRYAMNTRDEMAKERLEKALGKRNFKVLASAYESQGEASPLQKIELFMRTADYFAYIDKNLTNPRERRENIEELIHFAGRYNELAPFLEEISLLQSTDAMGGTKKDPSKTKVNLMTVHLAKGLEFDRVFIVGATEGLMPHARSMGSESELQEERRLMYVAMTRARQKLHLSFYGIPSRFLGEIPEDAVEFQSMLTTNGKLDLLEDDYEERYISWD